MLPINAPTGDHGADIFRICAASYTDAARVTSLLMEEGRIRVACDSFIDHARTVQFWRVPKTRNQHITHAQMIAIYEDRFVGGVGRDRYELMVSALDTSGICPMCGIHLATTLDHYLPKRNWPLLAVAPENLVPSCRDCNTVKLTTTPTSAETQTLHPYYDRLEDVQWIRLRIRTAPTYGLVFMPSPPESWGLEQCARAKCHFKTFDIGRLYGSYAGQYLTGAKARLMDEFERAGPSGIAAELSSAARAFSSYHKNSWQAVAFPTLAASSWFCEEGWREIPDPKRILTLKAEATA